MSDQPSTSVPSGEGASTPHASDSRARDSHASDSHASDSHASDSHVHNKSGPVQPAIRVMLMPKDTNGMGTIFGGIILSYIDLAGAVEARRYARGPVVTAAVREVEFHQPVFVGDIVSFHTETLEIGCTSVTVRVLVEAERKDHSRATVRVTEAEVVYVHIDSTNRPTSLDESLVRAAGLEPRC